MGLILGMDIYVFIAWIGTILAAILCILYGIYQEFFKKKEEEPSRKQKKNQKKRRGNRWM